MKNVCVVTGGGSGIGFAAAKEAASTYLKFAAIKRNGRPEEIAPLYVALIDESLSYLTGTDILCDGGCIAGGASAFAR